MSQYSPSSHFRKHRILSTLKIVEKNESYPNLLHIAHKGHKALAFKRLWCAIDITPYCTQKDSDGRLEAKDGSFILECHGRDYK